MTVIKPEITILSGSSTEKARGFPDRFSQRPFFILATALDQALGEFFFRSYFAAAVKFTMPRSILVVVYRNDRSYKNAILGVNPYIDGTFCLASGASVPLDAFNGAVGRDTVSGIEEFMRNGYCWPDLVLVPSMMEAYDLTRFEQLPVFAIPKAKRSGLDERLVKLGLNPLRWYICLHYREPTYKLSVASPYRDVDDRPFEEITNWIIDELGGQVVRIGHPQMRLFPARAGFVDLSAFEDEFFLQMSAISRARFMLTTASGPSVVPGSFGVPFVVTNAISSHCAWDRSHLLLPRPIFAPDGRRVLIDSMLRTGAWNHQTIKKLVRDKGFTVGDNSFEELREVTRMLFEQTADVIGWRNPPEKMKAPVASPYHPGQPIKREVTLVQFPELAPNVATVPGRT